MSQMDKLKHAHKLTQKQQITAESSDLRQQQLLSQAESHWERPAHTDTKTDIIHLMRHYNIS